MSTVRSIGRTIQNVRRLQEILAVLARYGFDDVVQDLGLDRLLDRGMKWLGISKPDQAIIRLPPEVRIRKALESLGPTFVKLGQVLSTRPDLVPPAWAEEFRKLQDDVAPVSAEAIRESLNAEYPQGIDAVFVSIEEQPMGAASIAQVHRGELRGGHPVVLKVLRPGIREVIKADMDLLRVLADLVEDHFSNLGYSPSEVIEQFSRELTRETDMAREGRACDRFRESFSDNPFVDFPYVYWDATTTNVLVMSEAQGVRLSRREPADFSEQDMRGIVAHATDAIFRQCLELGFFHADPHPGNIFAEPGGKITFIDCGLTGHIDPETANLLADLLHGVIDRDIEKVVLSTLLIADADLALAQDRAFRADVWEFIVRFEHSNLERLEIGVLLGEFFDRLRRHKLACPSDIVFLIKALTTIEGVAEALVPDFDVIKHVQPHIENLLRKRFGVRAMRRRMQSSMVSYMRLIEELPSQVTMLFRDVRRNRFSVSLEHRGLDRLTNTIEHASINIAEAMIVASIVLGSSILILADRVSTGYSILTVLATIGFVSAAGMVAGRFLGNRFTRKP